MTDLRLVVFDMDGTLIDSQVFIVEAMKRAFSRTNHPVPDKEQVLSIIGLSLDKAIETILPELSAKDIEETVHQYRQAFIDLRAEKGGEGAVEMYAGARDALDNLYNQENVLMGVATGKAKRGLDHAYRSHNIGHYFVTSQTADDHPSKPHPSMLERALYETGCDAKNAVIVGDTTFDIEMGKAAGFKTIAVGWGYHSIERIKQSNPDVIIENYAELDEALTGIWRQT